MQTAWIRMRCRATRRLTWISTGSKLFDTQSLISPTMSVIEALWNSKQTRNSEDDNLFGGKSVRLKQKQTKYKCIALAQILSGIVACLILRLLLQDVSSLWQKTNQNDSLMIAFFAKMCSRPRWCIRVVKRNTIYCIAGINNKCWRGLILDIQ